MSHPIHRVQSCDQIAPFTLRVRFGSGLERVINLASVLAGELFGRLPDPGIFSQVRVDPAVRTLVWPTGADFDPATLHDWPEFVAAFRATIVRWQSEPIPA